MKLEERSSTIYSHLFSSLHPCQLTMAACRFCRFSTSCMRSRWLGVDRFGSGLEFGRAFPGPSIRPISASTIAYPAYCRLLEACRCLSPSYASWSSRSTEASQPASTSCSDAENRGLCSCDCLRSALSSLQVCEATEGQRLHDIHPQSISAHCICFARRRQEHAYCQTSRGLAVSFCSLLLVQGHAKASVRRWLR